MACGSLFTANDYLDWGASHSAVGYSGFGEAIDPSSTTGPYNGNATTHDGVGVNVTSPNAMNIGRVDNTVYAWNGLFWTSPQIVAGFPIYTYGLRFNAPSSPASTPLFGDNLLGVFNSTGSDSEMTLNFGSQIQGVAFRISSTYNPDFTALLQAFDSSNNLLGAYQVVATGLGGACLGLNGPDSGGDPVPCNDAPFIQFLDPSGQISSIQLTVNDPHGAVIDELGILDPVAVPEPGTALGTGLAVMAGLLIGRKRVARPA